jgi:5-methylcytosine-specific restriction endonuclease McrA
MISSASRRRVVARAGNRCEYCKLLQEDDPWVRFQVEHVLPRQHGGGNDQDNLALACLNCNAHKGPNLAGIDPETGQMERLFNPRKDSWPDHFEVVGPRLNSLRR